MNDKITDVNDAGKTVGVQFRMRQNTAWDLHESGWTLWTPWMDGQAPADTKRIQFQERNVFAAPPNLEQQRDMLLEALKGIMNAEMHSLHVGYDQGGNYVYADVVRLDDEALRVARDAIKAAEGE